MWRSFSEALGEGKDNQDLIVICVGVVVLFFGFFLCVWFSAFGICFLFFGVWLSVFSVWCLVFGVWCLVFGATNAGQHSKVLLSRSAAAI